MQGTNCDEKAGRDQQGADIERGGNDGYFSIPWPASVYSSHPRADLAETNLNHDFIGPAATLGEPQGTIKSTTRKESISRVSDGRRASLCQTRQFKAVPRSKSRGLFARLALVPEAEVAYDYKNSTKWGITFTVALATAAAPLGSTIVYPTLPDVSRDFGSSEAIANLTVSMYLIAMSICPLWWSSFSEEFGRRNIYIISFGLFVLSSVGSAMSTSITMLIIFRVCGGGASASVQATGAGTIADIWESFERGTAMSIFYLGPLTGPLIAPVVGGALTEAMGWRSAMWFLVIYGAVIFIMLVLFLPETLVRRQKTEHDAHQRPGLRRMSTSQSFIVETGRAAKAFKRFIIDPLSVLSFLRFPAVIVTVSLAAMAFFALFSCNIAIQKMFSMPPYNFNNLHLGLLYLPSGLGYFLASFFGGKWIDRIMAREARKEERYDENGKLILLPEDRLRENAWIANTMYPLSLIVFGWSLQFGVQFMVPAISLFVFGVGSMLVFSASTTMLTEFVRKRSSAGVAINNFVRNLLSCLGAGVSAPWIRAVGAGWVMTTICFMCLAVGYFGIWTLRRKAPRWRKSMDEALQSL